MGHYVAAPNGIPRELLEHAILLGPGMEGAPLSSVVAVLYVPPASSLHAVQPRQNISGFIHRFRQSISRHLCHRARQMHQDAVPTAPVYLQQTARVDSQINQRASPIRDDDGNRRRTPCEFLSGLVSHRRLAVPQ